MKKAVALFLLFFMVVLYMPVYAEEASIDENQSQSEDIWNTLFQYLTENQAEKNNTAEMLLADEKAEITSDISRILQAIDQLTPEQLIEINNYINTKLDGFNASSDDPYVIELMKEYTNGQVIYDKNGLIIVWLGDYIIDEEHVYAHLAMVNNSDIKLEVICSPKVNGISCGNWNTDITMSPHEKRVLNYSCMADRSKIAQNKIVEITKWSLNISIKKDRKGELIDTKYVELECDLNILDLYPELNGLVTLNH